MKIKMDKNFNRLYQKSYYQKVKLKALMFFAKYEKKKMQVQLRIKKYIDEGNKSLDDLVNSLEEITPKQIATFLAFIALVHYVGISSFNLYEKNSNDKIVAESRIAEEVLDDYILDDAHYVLERADLQSPEIQTPLTNLIEFLDDKDYSRYNGLYSNRNESEKRNKKIHEYLYKGFYYICVKYLAGESEKEPDLNERLNRYFEAVLNTNSIVLVYENSNLISDIEGINELNREGSVGVCYNTKNKIIILNRENEIDTIKGLLHELEHINSGDIVLPEDISNLNLGYEVEEKYNKIKDELAKMFIEGRASSVVGKITDEKNTDVFHCVSSLNNEIFFSTYTTYPFYCILYKSYEMLLGEQFFYDWMYNDESDKKLTYKNVDFKQMKEELDRKYGEGTFERLFKNTLDILFTHSEMQKNNEDIMYLKDEFNINIFLPVNNLQEIDYYIELINNSFPNKTDQEREKAITILHSLKEVTQEKVKLENLNVFFFQKEVMECILQDVKGISNCGKYKNSIQNNTTDEQNKIIFDYFDNYNIHFCNNEFDINNEFINELNEHEIKSSSFNQNDILFDLSEEQGEDR